MHTVTTPFALERYKRKDVRFEPDEVGWRGTSAEFGEITVTCRGGNGDDEYRMAARVRGGSIPAAGFEVTGFHVAHLFAPTLNRAVLRVGDRSVAMRRNRLGITHRGRALRMTHAGDEYRLRAVNRKRYVLSRRGDTEDPGVTIAVKLSGFPGGRRYQVTVQGRAEGADIALATLFTAVDRANLTRRGAFRAVFKRAFGHVLHINS
ncbi:hypothetical protein [Streptomyces qinzhouensis]|uniref:Uncharacterized protein n=1 Tax=Streptomyces qinzhouensis TaxID=2599401 RepID=A0A5B8JGB3_9ACTN|nr:hypothetical protein [Streptomyces qinzhouensis]QDY80506.1 hypothetical protein FQU76_32810 [Streptomyces qinzhouensis]